MKTRANRPPRRHRIDARLLAVAAFAATLAASSAAWPYAFTGAKWGNGALPVQYYVNYASSTQLGRTSTQQIIDASFGVWNAPACTRFRSTNRGDLAGGVANASDNKNVLLWRYGRGNWPRELGGSSTIGVTSPVYFPGSNGQLGTMSDADIQFNGVDYSWTTNPRTFNEVDAQSIATHEIGHLLGLDHSASVSATMYASYQGGTGARTLHPDDTAGVCALYPSGPGSECSMSMPCPNNGTCQNGYCVPAAPSGGELGASCSGENICNDPLYCVCTDANQTNCFCTKDCSDTAPCPMSWSCQPLEGGGGACIPSSSGGTGTLGDACDSGADCANGLCVGTGANAGICTQSCTAATGCPSGYRCATLQSGGGACIVGANPIDGGVRDGGVRPDAGPRDAGAPAGSKELGEGCGAAPECRSNYCAYLTPSERLCSRPCQNDDGCPNDYACAASATGTRFCFPRDRVPADGGSSEEDAGTSEDDAGAQDEDAGTTEGDGGSEQVPQRKSGCSTAGNDASLGLAMWLLVAALVVARRRRRAG